MTAEDILAEIKPQFVPGAFRPGLHPQGAATRQNRQEAQDGEVLNEIRRKTSISMFEKQISRGAILCVDSL